MIFYIAGPLRPRDDDDQPLTGEAGRAKAQANIDMAVTAARYVFAMGHSAICVHPLVDMDNIEAPMDDWLEQDLRLIDAADAVLLMDGWSISEGCKKEFRYAYHEGKPDYGLHGAAVELNWPKGFSQWMEEQ